MRAEGHGFFCQQIKGRDPLENRLVVRLLQDLELLVEITASAKDRSVQQPDLAQACSHGRHCFWGKDNEPFDAL